MKDFTDCIIHSGLYQFNFVGAFFTWTNKSMWPRIDRALHNEF